MRPKPFKLTNNHHLKMCISLRRHYSYPKIKNGQSLILPHKGIEKGKAF